MDGEMKLKPCPFCGGEARYRLDHTTERVDTVSCHHCGFYLSDPNGTGSCITAWNRRSPDPELAEALKALVFNSTHGNGLEAQHQALDRARDLLSRIREGGEPDRGDAMAGFRNIGRAALQKDTDNG